jgi:hypothetical protein
VTPHIHGFYNEEFDEEKRSPRSGLSLRKAKLVRRTFLTLPSISAQLHIVGNEVWGIVRDSGDSAADLQLVIRWIGPVGVSRMRMHIMNALNCMHVSRH